MSYPPYLASDFPMHLPPNFPTELPPDWVFSQLPVPLSAVQPEIPDQPQYNLQPDLEPVNEPELSYGCEAEPMEDLDRVPTSLREQQPSEQVSTDKAYLKTQTDQGFVYTHPSAGWTFGKAPNRQEEIDKVMKLKYPGNPWGMWKGKQEWEIVKWMATKQVVQGDLDELLATELVSTSSIMYTQKAHQPAVQELSLLFRSAKQLFDRIEKEMRDVSSPKWYFEEFGMAEASNKTHVLVYRDLKECGDYLMGTPKFCWSITR